MEFDKFFSDDQNKFDYIHMATFKSSRAPVIKHNYNNISSFERCLKGNNQILTMLIDLVTMRHALWLTTCRTPMPLSPHSYKKQEFTYGILRLESLYSQITFCWWRKMPLMRKHRVDYFCAAVISYPHYTYKHYLLLLLVIISKWHLNNCCLIPTWLKS